MKKGFTLIEMLISISILSIMMLFLYKSYSSLNISNEIYKKEANNLLSPDSVKKTLFLDFSLALYRSISMQNQEKNEDVVFLQTSNSNHKNYNPYVAYVLKESKLYRLESFRPYSGYPLSVDDEFSVDILGDVKTFRVYKSDKKVDSNETSDTESLEVYLIHIEFLDNKEILLKVKSLNEY